VREGRQEPSLPSIYRPARIEAASGQPGMALLRRATDAPEGTLLWSEARGRLSLALLLLPDRDWEESAPVAIAAIVALGDAIGALAPPTVAVTNWWPDRLEINAGLVGGVALDALGPDPSAPARLILRTEVAVASSGGAEPGHFPDVTSLAEEGCEEITPILLLESFARHFLSWLHRWQEDGFAPLRASWRARGPRIGTPLAIELRGRLQRGSFRDLGPGGELVLQAEGAERGIRLGEALASGPTWTLP
jgi:BirA family biotin operon repressor/biotin-[acetyl-CoA-carboxylase] ligase